MGWRVAHGPPRGWGCAVNPGGRGLWVPIARPQSAESSVHKVIAASRQAERAQSRLLWRAAPGFRTRLKTLDEGLFWIAFAFALEGREGWGFWDCHPWTHLGPSQPKGGSSSVSQEPQLSTEMSPPPCSIP